MEKTSSVLLTTLISVLLINLSCQEDRSDTVCQNEAFNAACAPDEVVMMTTATYGRISLSRCVQRDYGYVGCSNDVLRQSDTMCSGKHRCSIPIPNTDFDHVSSCPKDLKSYLTATYTCLKVVTAPEQQCANDFIRLDGSSPGYLASVVTEDSDKGGHNCPWLIVAQPGQKLNITLIDLTQPGAGGLNDRKCQAYAIFKEPDSDGKPQTICGGDVRERHVYMSEAESLEIRFFKASALSSKRFLLRYEAISCPDPDLPPNAAMKKDDDVITVQCTTSKGSWRMRCENNEWKTEGGEEIKCAAGTVDERPVTGGHGKTRIPFGLSIMIIVSIALILGVLILLFGLFILRRRRRQQEASMQHFYQGATKGGRTAQLPSIPPGGKDQDSMYQSSENEYEYIGELPPHYSSTHATQNVTNRQMELYQARKHEAGHCKQHPPANRKQLPHKDPKGCARYVEGFEPPAYFELDPEGGAAQDSAANSSAMTRVNQSVHEFSPYGYDHLVDQSGNSNHKSV